MLKGTLDDFTLPDVFRFLSQTKKTGGLAVERSAGRGTVYFRDGDVYFAESSLSRDPIGQKLVRMKAITEGQLRKALDEQASSDERLGQILLKQGVVDQNQLETGVRGQIEDAVFDLLRWELGEFTFASDDEVDPEIFISVSVENLIMEASRRLDELEVIRRKIPSETTVLAMAPTPPEGAAEINIAPTEWRILVLVNGARSVADIADEAGLDHFDAMKTLYGLVSAGLLEVPGAPSAMESLETLDDSFNDETSTETFGDETQSTDEALATGDHVADEPPPLSETGEADPLAPDLDQADTESSFDQAETETSFDQAETESSFDQPETETSFDQPETETSFDQAETETSFDQAETETSFDEPETEATLGETDTAWDAAPDGALEVLDEGSDVDPEPGLDPDREPAKVDKFAAVRELSDLFNQSEADASIPSFAPREVEREPEVVDEVEPPSTPHRVEDDEEITRSLISRLIDGVKGL